jgi:mono/diheme cytochrome c family protein
MSAPAWAAAGRCGAALLCVGLVLSGACLAAEEFQPKDSPEASVYRGNIVFMHYCQLCHGPQADGSGRAAKIYSPKPANLVMSDKNDAYWGMIIRRGGEALARSKFMPPWGEELTDEQIRDVVAYLHSINKNPDRAK